MATTGGGGTGYWPRTSGQALCQNQITATFTWQPATPDDVPPQSAIVVENASASYNLAGSAANQSCADGFGDAASGPNSSSQTSSGARYTVKPNPGAIFNVTCTPDVNVAGPGYPVYGYASVSVAYNAAAIPVTIGVVGTTRDVANNADAVLIGQQLTATLSAGGFTQSKWQWTASGDIFKDFVPTDMEGHPVELTSADKTKSGFVYYYRSISGNGPIKSTITCSATLLLPDGTMPTVTATRDLQVYAPMYTSVLLTSGNVIILNVAPTPQYLTPFNSRTERSMQWDGKTQTPTLFTAAGSGGWAVIQIVTPLISEDGVSLFPFGTTGVDGSYIYHGDSFAADGKYYTDWDNPNVGLTGLKSSATMDCSFKDYMMYQPPSANGCKVVLVPLWEWDWNFSGMANLFSLWTLGNPHGITVTKNALNTTIPTWSNVVNVPSR